MAISTNGTVLARVAGALYNTQMSNATYSEVASLDPASLTDALYARDFSNATDAAVATTLVTNLGLTSVEGLVNWVAAQLTAAGSHKGAKVVELLNGFAQMSADATYGAYATSFNAKVDAALALSQTAGNAGGTFVAAGTPVSGTFSLTAGVDEVLGTAGNDTIKGTLSGVSNADGTFKAIDIVNGGAGTDTFEIVDATGSLALPSLLNVSNVEVLSLRSAAALTADASTVAFVTVKSTQSAAATVTANAASNVEVSGATDAIVVDGGKNITVTDATANKAITVGGTTKAAGTVSITDTKQGTADITVTGGTDVTVTTTVSATTAAVAGGDVITSANTGNTTITQNSASNGGDADTDDLTAANISVSGAGASVAVVANATSTAVDESADGDIVMGTVTITAGTSTTTISVDNNATATKFTKAAVAVVKETESVKFTALTAGQDTIIDGLTFTASVNLTKEQVASAFANIAASGQGSAAASLGYYTGTISANYSSAAAEGEYVVFTAKDEDETLSLTAGTVDMTATNAAGTAAVAKDDSTNTVTYNAVVIDDNATADSVTTVTVDGYTGSSTIGATNTTSKLATLNLANADKDASMVVADTAATLALSLNAMASTAADTDEAIVTFTAAPTTLNVDVTGTNNVDLTAADTTKLNVSGTGTLNIADVDLAALTTLTVSGSAGVTMNGGESNTLTSVDTTATTGTVSATINGASSKYTGGTGVDKVTLATTASLTKAIDLGAGDDTVIFSASVSGSTAALAGGEGTDTISMTTANAASLDGTTQTFYTGFERLTVSTAAGTDDGTVDAIDLDLVKLGFTNYVTTSGTVYGTAGNVGFNDTLTLTGLVSSGTAVLTAKGLITVANSDFADGASDAVNLVANVAASSIDFGTLTASDVETVSISANDTKADDDGDGTTSTAESEAEDSTLVLTADAATTVSLTGSADVFLTLTGSTSITTINAANMTGDLSVTSLNTTAAATITGGSGDDTIVGAANNDVLVGGAGKDKLTADGELVTLTGGAGNDTFVMNTTDTVNGYATITDLTAGDVIDTLAATFKSTSINSLVGDTASFQDLANAAVNAVAADGAAWFQYSGNTYLVVDEVAANSTSFVNGTDQIIKITGLVNLSNAVFNSTTGDLTIG
jgi:S-layer protein